MYQWLLAAAFPPCRCLQFGAQEPGSNSDIKSFAKKNYGVTFPLMSKVDVNGQGGECMLVGWCQFTAAARIVAVHFVCCSSFHPGFVGGQHQHMAAMLAGPCI
jgi:hypothetical protein